MTAYVLDTDTLSLLDRLREIVVVSPPYDGEVKRL